MTYMGPLLAGYLCPVCSYPDLEHPPQDFTICPCCGTEFGLDDFSPSAERTEALRRTLRQRWLENGGPWFDPGTPQPQNWDGPKQLWQSPLFLAVEKSAEDVPQVVVTRLKASKRLVHA